MKDSVLDIAMMVVIAALAGSVVALTMQLRPLRIESACTADVDEPETAP